MHSTAIYPNTRERAQELRIKFDPESNAVVVVGQLAFLHYVNLLLLSPYSPVSFLIFSLLLLYSCSIDTIVLSHLLTLANPFFFCKPPPSVVGLTIMDPNVTPNETVHNDVSNKYDVVIIGAGPVGLLLSTCLARWGYKIKHIDNRPEPTKTGRADGIQPRSLDLLRNMGLKPAIMAHEPAKVYEVAFWDPSSTESGIHRTGTWASCPSFIDARYPFTTLLHQGLIERVFISDLEKNGVNVQRPWTIKGFKTDGNADPEFPVEVDLEHVDGKGKETVRARYLFSGEGARSFVRDQLKIGIKHKDPIAHVWGVMDGVVKTDFPDIKVGTA